MHWPKITSHMLYHAETGRRQIKYAEALALATALGVELDAFDPGCARQCRERGAPTHPHAAESARVCAAPTTGACAITAPSLMTCRSAATRSPKSGVLLVGSTSPTRPLSPITLIARDHNVPGIRQALTREKETHDRQ